MSISKSTNSLLIALATCFTTTVWCSEEDNSLETKPNKSDFKPVVFDSDKTDSSTLGIEYEFSGSLFNHDLDSKDDSNCSTFPCSKTIISSALIKYDLSGVLAENANNNPKNFVEFDLQGNYFRASVESKIIWSAGLYIKYETNQTFDDKQFVYGVNGELSHRDLFRSNDFAFLQVKVGTVDPTNDEARQAILGNDLDSYDRVDIEIVYQFQIKKGFLDTFEINYRYFKEINAMPEIKSESLDDFRLITYHLGLTNQMYLAYSSGELPFNQKDNQIFEIGYTYKFD
jgi:hypothetical protein